MDFFVIALIAFVCILAGLTVGFMSRNSTIDKLTADRDRHKARADKLSESLNEYRRSAEVDGEPRSYGGWNSPTGRREQPRRSAHGTVRPMPRQTRTDDDRYEDRTDVYVPPAPYEYETVRYEETRTEPANESRTETHSAPYEPPSTYTDSAGTSASSD